MIRIDFQGIEMDSIRRLYFQRAQPNTGNPPILNIRFQGP